MGRDVGVSATHSMHMWLCKAHAGAQFHLAPSAHSLVCRAKKVKAPDTGPQNLRACHVGDERPELELAGQVQHPERGIRQLLQAKLCSVRWHGGWRWRPDGSGSGTLPAVRPGLAAPSSCRRAASAHPANATQAGQCNSRLAAAALAAPAGPPLAHARGRARWWWGCTPGPATPAPPPPARSLQCACARAASAGPGWSGCPPLKLPSRSSAPAPAAPRRQGTAVSGDQVEVESAPPCLSGSLQVAQLLQRGLLHAARSCGDVQGARSGTLVTAARGGSSALRRRAGGAHAPLRCLATLPTLYLACSGCAAGR